MESVTLDLEALERFVIENDELLELESRIGRFNVFDALGIARMEIRHSNFLSWICDPVESHGQGDVFFKALVMDLLRQAPIGHRPLNPIYVDSAEFGSIDVRREWRHIDLLLFSENPPLIIAIENKMHSNERVDKLDRYVHEVRATFPATPSMFVFLNPEGDDAPSDLWTSYSYERLHHVIRRTRNAHRDAIGADVLVFLDHYLNLLETRFMEDAELDRLCKAIYSKHRRAIDLINDRIGTPSSGVSSLLEQYLREREERWIIRKTISNMVSFVPRAWVGKLSDESGRPHRSAPCDFFIETYTSDKKIAVRLIAGQADDIDLRRQAVQSVLEVRDELGLTFPRKSVSNEWTRLYSRDVMSYDPDDPPTLEAVAAKFQSRLDELSSAIARIPDIVAAAASKHRRT